MNRVKLATALASVFFAASGSVPALALTTADGIQDESGKFYFYDNSLDPGSSGFGMLVKNGNNYTLQTYINSDNPSIFNPTVSESYSYRSDATYGFTISSFTYQKNYYSLYGYPTPNYVSYGYNLDEYKGGSSSLGWAEYYEDGKIKNSEDYSYVFDYGNFGLGIPDYVIHTIITEDSKVSSIAPFDSRVLGYMVDGAFPHFGYGIFDFLNSFIYYADGTSTELAFLLTNFDFDNGNLKISWSSSETITGITLAYAPIPEPETWAMLLVGLGVVGTVTRRRRTTA
ncbi:MAG: PEPxxWA-CTERM sorting domain-containing protein [Betaproteobacteria bacterium]|nr:PEPxxWA-CTERM sorting domain-containing protein [Betaproteobacteria bacterium]